MPSRNSTQNKTNAILLGIIFGMAVGIATANVPIGIGVGVAMAAAFSGNKKRDSGGPDT